MKNPKQKTTHNHLDRLTALPDALLVDILTLLPFKTAVTTSVLSTHYRLFWTHLTYLHLDYRLLTRLNSSVFIRLPNLQKVELSFRALECDFAVILKKMMDYLVSNAPVLKNITIVVIASQTEFDESVKYKLDEAFFCIDLYSYASYYSSCVIEFHGLHAKLPANETELEEMNDHAQQLRVILFIEEILKHDC